MKRFLCIFVLFLTLVFSLASCDIFLTTDEKDDQDDAAINENPQELSFYLTYIGTYGVEIGLARYDSRIEIPATYNGKAVTEIGDLGFSSDRLVEIVIPDSVMSISVSAFSNCSSLTNIIVSENNAFFKDIDGNLYNKNGNILIKYAVGKTETEFIIPNGVTSIRENAFSGCSSLTSVTIPDSVTSIGKSVFYKCSSLTSVIIGDSVTSIGNDAFFGCSSLTSVTIPDSVTSIGDWTFYRCSGLTSVIIGDSVTRIGERAFCNCSSLTSVIIGDSVTSIGYQAFEDCSSLTSITIPDSVTGIADYAFSNCSSLASVTIPDSVARIGYRAFYMCSSLTSIKYRGTKSQWDEVRKTYEWKSGTGSYTITYGYTDN